MKSRSPLPGDADSDALGSTNCDVGAMKCLQFVRISVALFVLIAAGLPLKAEIVSQWSFDDNLDDTAPAGVSADGLEASGDPSYASGVVGGAVNLTADGLQRLRAPDSDDLDLAASWTLEAFVWPDADNGGEWDRFWTKWGDGGNEWHTSFRSTGAVEVENGLDLFINGGNNIINSNSTAQVPLEEWSHVAFVGDAEANTITAWLNGEKVGEAVYEEVTPGGGAMNFGNFESPANSLQYSGLIDEAIIHNAAVDEAYLEGRAQLLSLLGSANPVVRWSFEDNLDDTASSGSTNDTLEPFGDPEYADGVVGRAVNLTADGLQRLRAEDSDDLDLAESWTLEAFVWPDADNGGEWDRFWTKWGDGGNEWHTAFRSTGAVEVENGLDLFINGGNNIINSNNTAQVPLEEWSHVAFVGDAEANTISAWLNGENVGEAVYEEVTPGSGAVNFGNFESPANSLQYSGLIDEAIIHDAAVDEAYLEGRAQLLLGGANPVVRWSFEDNLDDTAPSGGTNDTLEPFGDPEYVPGVPGIGGKAINVTADGLQRLRAEDSDDLDLAASWTLEAFVWPDADNGGEWDRFWTKWGDGGNEWHTAFRSTGAVEVENGLDLFINGGNNIINSNSTAQVPLEEWSHVAFVGDAEANTITAWLNGEKVGEAVYEEVTPGSGAVNFGNFESPANSLQYSGLIDEASIHAEAVTDGYLQFRGGLIRDRMAPTDITLSSTILLSSLMVGDSAATIDVVDPNSEDTHTLELVPGEGDTNNALFKVEGDQLQTAASLEGELGNTLSIRLRATDSTQATFEKTFDLIVGVDVSSLTGRS